MRDLFKIKHLIFVSCLLLMSGLPAADANPVFIENKGQWPSEVLFRADFPGYHAWITKKGLVLNLFRITEEIQSNEPLPVRKKSSFRVQGDVVYFFHDENQADKLIPGGKNKKSAFYNFFISGKRITNVPAYEEVWVRDVYPGIDQRWYADNGLLRFDYVVHRGADYHAIKILTDPFTQVTIKSNAAQLQTRFGPLRIMELHCFQNGKELKARLKTDNGKIKFEIEGYDKNQDLIIDPVLFATYLGGSASDMNPIVRCDANNDIIVACNSLSMDFPVTPGSYDMNANGNNDVCISKLSSNGSNLLFSTYIGGSGYDYVTGMELNSSGEIYICGLTESANWPLSASFLDNNFSGTSESFLCRLNANANQILYSTFLGGNMEEQITAMKLTNNQEVIVAGNTSSQNFTATAQAYDVSFNGGDDIFVAKINTASNQIIFSTFIGGSQTDMCNDIALDASGNIYGVGFTYSLDFPMTINTYTNLTGTALAKGTLFKLSSNGQQLLNSSNKFNNINYKILCHQTTNNIILIGYNGLPAISVCAFLMPPSLNNVSKITQLRYIVPALSQNFISNCDVSFNTAQNRIIIGLAELFDEFDYPDNLLSTYNMVVFKFDVQLNLLGKFTIGTPDNEYFNSLTIDSDNKIILGGYLSHGQFPCSTNAYDNNFNGSNDLFIIKHDTCSSAYIFHLPNHPICSGDTLAIFQYNPYQPGTLTWQGPNNLISSGTHNSVFGNLLYFASASQSLSGTYSVQYTDPQGCLITGTYNILIHNVPKPTPTIQISPSPPCPHGTIQLTALPSGLSSYTWQEILFNNPPIYNTYTQNPLLIPLTNGINKNFKLTVTNSVGCVGTSSININITTPYVNQNIINSNVVLTLAVSNSPTYQAQWLDCNNNMQPVPGATLSTFTITQNGSYAAAWAYGSCSGTTACQSVSPIGLNELSSPANAWTLFPNPSSNGQFFILASHDISVSILDVSGKILHRNLFIPKGMQDVKIHLPPGIYFIREEKSGSLKKWVVY